MTQHNCVLLFLFAGPPLTGKMSNLREFETSTDSSYSCSESKLSDSFEVTFSNMQFEAYNDNAGSDFKTAVACRVTIDWRTDPYRNANHVGIAVGVSIGVLLLGAAGAVLISRYRKRRKAAAAIIRTDTTYQQFDN
ncbi:hypothetical protein B566_EDAN012137 [Ephemera danica]|nr:hypothetical protein B566_EDAN012137 [Ephemera danica]